MVTGINRTTTLSLTRHVLVALRALRCPVSRHQHAPKYGAGTDLVTKSVRVNLKVKPCCEVQRVNKYNLHSSHYNKAFITNSVHMRYGVKGQSAGYPEFRGPRDQFARAVLFPDGESWQNRDGVPRGTTVGYSGARFVVELYSWSPNREHIETGANIYGEHRTKRSARARPALGACDNAYSPWLRRQYICRGAPLQATFWRSIHTQQLHGCHASSRRFVPCGGRAAVPSAGQQQGRGAIPPWIAPLPPVSTPRPAQRAQAPWSGVA
jgi:hypothetical protein